MGARADVSTAEEFAQLMADQLPFHFADPLDPRIADYPERTAGHRVRAGRAPPFSANGYGGIEVEDRLGEIAQPVWSSPAATIGPARSRPPRRSPAGIPDAELPSSSTAAT